MNDNFRKHIYQISYLSPLATLPAFILTVDWGRWFAAAIISQFTLLIYFLANDDEVVLLAVSSMKERLSKYRPSFWLGMLLLFYMLAGRFEASLILSSARRVANGVIGILVIIKHWIM